MDRISSRTPSSSSKHAVTRDFSHHKRRSFFSKLGQAVKDGIDSFRQGFRSGGQVGAGGGDGGSAGQDPPTKPPPQPNLTSTPQEVHPSPPQPNLPSTSQEVHPGQPQPNLPSTSQEVHLGPPLVEPDTQIPTPTRVVSQPVSPSLTIILSIRTESSSSSTLVPPMAALMQTTVSVTTTVNRDTPVTTSGMPPALPTAITSNTRSNGRLVTILLATSGAMLVLVLCFGLWFFCVRHRKKVLRQEEDWKWFDKWQRRHKTVSVINESQDNGEGKFGPFLTEHNVGKLAARSPKTEPLPRPSSVTSNPKPKVRIVSMGGITNQTGTTSNTNLVIALPPPLTSKSVLPLHHYNPDAQPPTHQPADVLITSAIRNAQMMLSSSNERRH